MIRFLENIFVEFLVLFGRASIGVNVLLNHIFPPLKRIEREVIRQIRPSIKNEYIDVFDEHVSKVNYMQRQSADKISVLFAWRFPGWYQYKRNRYFPDKGKPTRLLRYRLDFENRPEPVFGYLVSIDGVLCNLTFGEHLSLLRKSGQVEVKVLSGIIVDKKMI